jgi:hypothetical protein
VFEFPQNVSFGLHLNAALFLISFMKININWRCMEIGNLA